MTRTPPTLQQFINVPCDSLITLIDSQLTSFPIAQVFQLSKEKQNELMRDNKIARATFACLVRNTFPVVDPDSEQAINTILEDYKKPFTFSDVYEVVQVAGGAFFLTDTLVTPHVLEIITLRKQIPDEEWSLLERPLIEAYQPKLSDTSLDLKSIFEVMCSILCYRHENWPTETVFDLDNFEHVEKETHVPVATLYNILEQKNRFKSLSGFFIIILEAHLKIAQYPGDYLLDCAKVSIAKCKRLKEAPPETIDYFQDILEKTTLLNPKLSKEHLLLHRAIIPKEEWNLISHIVTDKYESANNSVSEDKYSDIDWDDFDAAYSSRKQELSINGTIPIKEVFEVTCSLLCRDGGTFYDEQNKQWPSSTQYPLTDLKQVQTKTRIPVYRMFSALMQGNVSIAAGFLFLLNSCILSTQYPGSLLISCTEYLVKKELENPYACCAFVKREGNDLLRQAKDLITPMLSPDLAPLTLSEEESSLRSTSSLKRVRKK